MGCDGKWNTVVVSRGQGAFVVIYSPPYGENARAPDFVTVLWDGEEVFSEVLPTNRSRIQGMPVTLLKIHCDPGNHILEVKHGTRSQKERVNLNNQDTRYYMIFGGIQNGKETLLEDLGGTLPVFL